MMAKLKEEVTKTFGKDIILSANGKTKYASYLLLICFFASLEMILLPYSHKKDIA